VSVKRDDLIHPTISGNKWRKLKYTLLHAKQQGVSQLVSFGGAYSNHIHALAFAGKTCGFETHGIIRGEFYPDNPTLQDAQHAGMKLHFVTREQYRQRTDLQYLSQLQQQFPNALIIPEGGTSEHALAGVADVMNEIATHHPDYIVTPCGSGGTTAGLLSASSDTQVISIPVLKNAGYLKQEINQLTSQIATPKQWHFIEDYHFGGYGKIKPELLRFIESVHREHDLVLEPIYSGKMFYAVFDLIEKDYFPVGSHVVLLHTGGLQGLNGLIQRNIVPKQWLGWHRNENVIIG